MFEGVVSQVLAGYLGRFVKGIQKDQLKIGIWNEEILLEKVELILEAFDYLQLPFALKEGRVGKLSIRIPWKKLGWEPIIVVLENIFICACQREDNEWSSDSVEKRELAGKMAKLNAIELAKLSRRVSDDQAGQSFISYISAKILDNIQVSIRNVHIIYVDSHKDQDSFIFGLTLSSLTVLTDTQKLNITGSSMVKSRSGQVRKVVEISRVGLYCNSVEGNHNLFSPSDVQLFSSSMLDYEKYDYIVNPFDFVVSLLVNKAGKLDGTPEYDITVEITTLVLLLNEIQLKQIMGLWDYFSICTLRKKYGRYRPPQSSLSMKIQGWQKMWWHYAHKSILSDVRQRLKRTSLRNLGERIIYCQKYVKLYKRKLELLQQDQLVSKSILQELEKMDRDCDIDDILSYRSLAEQQLQESLFKLETSNGSKFAEEKDQNVEQASSKARSWLNWLSLGMLGAGGTSDTGSFAGVVSDEIIKDIYEATEFYPVPSLSNDSSPKKKSCLSVVKFSVRHIITSVRSSRFENSAAKAICDMFFSECKFWDDSAAILASVDSIKIVNPENGNVILMDKETDEDSLAISKLPFLSIHVNFPYSDQKFDVSTKIVLGPFEANLGSEFFLYIQHLYHTISSFKFQQDRVLSSLNRLKSSEARLLKKIEYYFCNHKKLYWDVTLDKAILNLPLQIEELKVLSMVLEFQAFSFRSRAEVESSQVLSGKVYWENICPRDPTSGAQLNFRIEDVYNHFEIELAGFKVKILEPEIPRVLPVIEDFNATCHTELCIFLDEPTLKMLEVRCLVPKLVMHFSPEIFRALLRAEDFFSVLESPAFAGEDPYVSVTENIAHGSQFSVSVKLDSWQCNIDLGDDAENNALISFSLGNIDFMYALEEAMKCWFLVKMLTIDCFHLKDNSNCSILCSTGNDITDTINESVEHSGASLPELSSSENSGQGCLELHYQAQAGGCVMQQECSLHLYDVDLHIYPKIFGLLQKFFGKLRMQSSFSDIPVNSSRLSENSMGMEMVGREFDKFAFSNYDTSKETESPQISLDHFPFVSIINSGYLNSLESSMILGMPELRKLCLKENENSKCLNLNFMQRPRIAENPNMPSFGNAARLSTSSNHNGFNMEFSLNRIRAYFHDSSCILGRFMVPTSISYLRFCHTDCWDLQSSIQGLTLSSSWSFPNIHEVLWGPSSASNLPVLNIRLRKGTMETMLPITEISIGIQHVCCILSSEFLSLLIGYFSLPDWTTQDKSNDIAESENYQNTGNSLLYKFEVLDSTLLLPLENHDHCIQIVFPQLVSSFIPICSSADAFREIPSDCIISECKCSDSVSIVNAFGRNASLSLLLLRRDENFFVKPGECMSNECIPVIAQLDADLWIRIPCNTKDIPQESIMPLLIMVRVSICNLVARDDYFIRVLEGVDNVIDQFLSVPEKSEMYTSDVMHFLQCSRNVKKKDVSLDMSSPPIINVRCCIKALSMSLCQFRVEDSLPSLVAKVEMQLNLSAIVVHEMLQSLDANIPCLVVRSSSNNILIVSFTPEVDSSSPICFKFSNSFGPKHELLVTVARLDFWLHLLDWNNIIDHLQSYTTHLEATSISSTANVQSGCTIAADPMNVIWKIKSENITVSLHVPSSSDGELIDSDMIEVNKLNYVEVCCRNLAESMPPLRSKNCKFVKLTFHSKNCEMIISENCIELKCHLDRMRVMLEMVLNSEKKSIPFMHVSQMRIGISLSRKQRELIDMSSEISVESFDIGVSYQVLYFWSCFLIEIPEKASSPVSHHLVFKVHLKKGSLLLSDGRWSYHGPILETLIKNMLVQFKQTEDIIEGSVVADLLVNYNNIDKVMWEPFLEPWSFELKLTRENAGHILDRYTVTDAYLKSTKVLNLNITEPLIEAIFRLNHVVNDAFNHDGAFGFQETSGILGLQTTEDMHTRRYAPYILHNETSLPLTYHVHHGAINMDDIHSFNMNNENFVQPGFSVPIYVEETLDEQFFQHRSSHSSERLIEKKMSAIAHHMISIYFEGTSGPSRPMSMDLVGLSYFEVSFSKKKNSVISEADNDVKTLGYNWRPEEQYKSDKHEGLVVPVVFEVSMQHYSKIIRLYSTVILFNATSVPLELRFDIPFGVSSKVLGPILPGHEIPLPLHLAESGQIRWHPAGTHYLWSEAHSLSNILSQENRHGYLRSFVCYPSHPSSDPFRCCISIQDYSLSSASAAEKHSSINILETGLPLSRSNKLNIPKKHFIRHVRLITPLLVKNYLPTFLFLTIECGGVAHSASLSEVGTTSVYHVDCTHDLAITFEMKGFRHITSKFPRAESFSALGRLNGSFYSSSEKVTFYPENKNGPICVTIDKTMDSSCGAREICLSVPFLLYNCTGLFLTVVDVNSEGKGSAVDIPSSYIEIEQKQLLPGKNGLALIPSELGSSSDAVLLDSSLDIIKQDNIFAKEDSKQSSVSRRKPIYKAGVSCSTSTDGKVGRSSSNLSRKVQEYVNYAHDGGDTKAKPCMYGPVGHIPANELLVKLSAALPKARSDIRQSEIWSKPFSLVPASGSTNVVIPHPFASGAFLTSVTSVTVSGELSGRTRAIIFQPRYVICNACNKDLFYRQKATNISHHLGVGQHSHLHWSDTSRELLVSLRFNEPGSQWSGNFLPDCLGDAQVKMRNYITGESSMVRVEVQNADMSTSKENVIENSSGHSVTNLILLSDDNTGFMPYRIDNFSMETLRIYQHRCESCDTTVHPYMSYQYAWDEPCYLHRLIIEVPGERILGAYSLDDVKKHEPVFLPSTTEKPERRLYISVHSEGAVKVLSIIDANYHIVNDIKGSNFLGFKDKKVIDQKINNGADFTEVFTIHVPYLGISLMNSTPQELVFTCAKETTIVLMQSLDQQKISLKISSLQIDNQLSDTPYPIMLSFDKDYRGRPTNILRNRENKSNFQKETTLESMVEPIFCFSAAKWRNMDNLLVSFEYINFSLAPLCIELEEQMLLSLFEYFRAVTSRLQSRSLERKFELGNQCCNSDGNVGNAQGYSGKNVSLENEFVGIQENCELLPSVFPVGAPWQQIFLLARRKKKIYVEVFELSPIKLSLSFSSTPWMIRNEVCADTESSAHIHSTILQRGLMALVDVEDVPVYFPQLTLAHLIASPESIQEIVTRHYMRQLFHEMYKVLGSAGVIGNPMGFARNVGLGIKDFLSHSGKGILQQSPGGLLTSIAHGSRGLLNSTIYAISSATSQFSKAAHKGIVAFTFDQQSASELEELQKHLDSHGKGVLNEFLEGLTGLLQFPIRGAEKHGLPGVVSGIAMGTAGLIARPVASILDATGKTAQSIRNRSSPHQSHHMRSRLPRPLAKEHPLSPYSWDEAIGVSMLLQANGSRLKDETFVMCKPLKQAGRFITICKRLVLVASCSSLLGLGSPEFAGIPPRLEWVVETEMSLESVVHIDRMEEVVNIVGSYPETVLKQNKGSTRNRPWNPSTSVPIFHMRIELPNTEEAEDTLQVLLSTIEEGKSRRWGMHVLQRSNLK
ncbi:hypothetical protein Cni_G03402 [Canna indica]|uniref:Vacuolar protein sorting-associated protein n=1 Tax=Canna indica TaxID=4628 RepID=A0AAQ3JTJ2_9LILI|nr:hypothetical protein Cni_G03402 [Canna indica]